MAASLLPHPLLGAILSGQLYSIPRRALDHDRDGCCSPSLLEFLRLLSVPLGGGRRFLRDQIAQCGFR
jgi:hypothetical protein